MIRTSLRHLPSDKNAEEKAAMRMRAYKDYAVVVIELDRLPWDQRGLIERVFLDQQNMLHLEEAAHSNLVRMRTGQ